MVLRGIKNSFIFILIFVLSVLLVSCNGEKIDPIVDDNDNNNTTIERETDKINQVYDHLKNKYYSELDLDIEKINTVEELLTYYDPYTRIYTTGSNNIEKDESYVGLGITVIDNDLGLLVNDVNSFVDVYKFVFAGDIITEVDGVSLEGLTFTQKSEKLKKELNETINLKIKRVNSLLEVSVETVEVPFLSVSYSKVDDIGYLKITRFANSTYNQFKTALETLEASNIKGLIIDVRDNGGGYLNAVNNILKLFVVSDEPMFYLYSPRSDKYTPYNGDSNATVKPYPINILVNNRSASASEVLAGVMQKQGHTLIGEKTYGKNVYQSGILLQSPFNDNEVLNYTAGYWLLDEFNSVGGGIYPDVLVYEKDVRNLLYPSLVKEYKKGEVSPYIGIYQYLINLSVEGDYILDLFDENFEQMVLAYQEANNITPTGILDVNTQKQLIILYKDLLNDLNYDELFNEAISYMETKINGN